MAQKPVLRGEVGCACVAREVSVERGGMGERGCANTVASFKVMEAGKAILWCRCHSQGCFVDNTNSFLSSQLSQRRFQASRPCSRLLNACLHTPIHTADAGCALWPYIWPWGFLCAFYKTATPSYSGSNKERNPRFAAALRSLRATLHVSGWEWARPNTVLVLVLRNR